MNGSSAVLEQSDQYLGMLFGDHPGYVATALKHTSGGWDEQTWEWPAQRADIYAWARANRRVADVFICPALRGSATRTKGDGAHLQWLWADVDFQDIPTKRHPEIMRRIAELATFTVKSGTGDNVHVYVKLARITTLDVWRRLNLGLRQWLSADAKHTDNALLRLPGTLNHKDTGGAVTMVTGNGATIAAGKLLTRDPWTDVVVGPDTAHNDGSYDTVDVSTLLTGRVKAMVSMPVDEAVGRYGSRHGAVYQVTTWLAKRGLTSDQIHTLMAAFPAGVDKEETEHGYALHKDIARCLGQHPTREDAITEVEDFGEAITDPDDDDADDSLDQAALKRARQWDIDDRAKQIRAHRAFTPPPESSSVRWADVRDLPRPPRHYVVDEIAAHGDNVTITGQYKAGKTMLSLNLAHSLVDHIPFLDQFKITHDVTGVGLWSCEMNPDALYDDYLGPMNLSHGGKPLAIWNGRGYGLSLMSKVGMMWAENWLRVNGVDVWIIDSFARLCRMAGVDENDNGAVLDLLHTLDQIKVSTGVHTTFMLLHTGRAEQMEGRERARGATVLDDWADTRWVYTRDGQVRFMSVEGRSVKDKPATSIDFDETTNHLRWGGLDKGGARVDGLVSVITTIVGENPGIGKAALIKKVQERAPANMKNQNVVADAITDAAESGFIEVRRVGAQKIEHWPTSSERPENGATPKELNMAKAGRERGRGPRRKRGARTEDDD
jgi:hypothetical protein